MLYSDLENYTYEQTEAYTYEQLERWMQFVQYIYNRTAQDVERWKTLRDKGWSGMTEDERQEWLDCKGMYTHNDLNRVERAVEALSKRLNLLGYKTLTEQTKTDWTHKDDFWDEDAERYFGNIEVIRKSIPVFSDTPMAPAVLEKLTYELANSIEKILSDIDTLSANIAETWHYSGELFTGEV